MTSVSDSESFMSRLFFRVFRIFRPSDEDLSREAKSLVQSHRLLSLLAALLVPFFGGLYDLSNPEATDPMWARLGVGAFFLLLLGVSYWSRRARRHYVEWMRVPLYVLMTWFVAVAALNGFTSNYAVGLLLVYAVLAVATGLGVQTIGPLLRFLGYGIAITTGAMALGPPPEASPFIVFPCLLTVAAVVSLVVEARLAMREKLRTAKEKAEEAAQLKSAMLANMSHEIRTPLTSINGFTEVLEEELSGSHADLAARVRRSGKRLMQTLDSILQLSQLEAGEATLKREPTRLGEVVETSAEMLQPKAVDQSVRLAVEVPDRPVKGKWNEGALRRIVQNLLENGIKFTPEGGRVDARVWIDEAAILEVEDTGIGIAEDALPEVFEAFKQESEGREREYEGSGLGLSIVHRLTQALGGEIEVNTEKGEGTCFVVRLPRNDPVSDDAAGNGVVT